MDIPFFKLTEYCRYRPEKISLVPGSRIGNATEATEAVIDKEGRLTLRYVFRPHASIVLINHPLLSLNPGRIDPTNAAWEEARKPLAAAWQTASGDRFYTVNVHLSSKRDSSSAQGDARPPVNGKSAQRTAQANVTAVSLL